MLKIILLFIAYFIIKHFYYNFTEKGKIQRDFKTSMKNFDKELKKQRLENRKQFIKEWKNK